MEDLRIPIFVAVVIALLLLFIIIYILTFHYMHHSYSSGEWVNSDGDILMIRNLGPLSDSQFKLCQSSGEKYDVLESTCKILTNPISLPHKFTVYMLDKPKLKAKIDMITGVLKLYSGGKFYGIFRRIST